MNYEVKLLQNSLHLKIIHISQNYIKLRPKTYSYLTDDGINSKKSKGTKNCVTEKFIRHNHFVKVLILMIIQMKIKQPYIRDHPYRILIIKDSGSGKKNALLNLINNQPDIGKIYFFAKYPYEAKYQYLINKHEKVGLKHYNDPKTFIMYSNDMQDVYKNIEEYNIGKKREVLIIFDDMMIIKN